jgi:hypothetical protein
MDDAFLRRLRFVIRFDPPDPARPIGSAEEPKDGAIQALVIGLRVVVRKAAQDVFSASIDGDLLRAWTSGELTSLERRTIVARMVDRIILHPSKRAGKRSGKDIAERVQIVLRGNELLVPEPQPAHAATVE